jgi:K+-sensing histidine kinase KdpD
MQLGYVLVKEQLFFRRELIERARWFIQLRWIAVGGAFIASWAAHALLEPKFPILPIDITIFAIAAYNIVFLIIYRRLKTHESRDVKPYAIFTHTQMGLDLLALFVMIYFTGGVTSPLLIFVIFHIILAGILLAPISCFIYGILTVIITGLLMALQVTAAQTPQPMLFRSLLFPPSALDFPNILIPYSAFAAAILITAFLVTTIKLSLRTKGRELLSISKELDASNAKLTALYEMVKEMGLCTDLQKLMDSATRNAATIMGVKGCSIKLLDDQRNTLKFASTFGLSQDYTAKGSIDIEKSPINRKIIEGSVYAIGNIDKKDYFQHPEDISKEGIVSMICLPLRIEKMVLGVFCVYSAVLDYFSDSDIKFFSLMAELTAIAIENLKSELTKAWFLQKSAHQLRSPLNAIYSMLEMVAKGYLGPVDPEQSKTIVRCERRIEILREFISDLLKLGIRRSDTFRSLLHPVEMKDTLVPLVQLYKMQASEKEIGIIFNIDESLPKIMGDEKLLNDLFTNLISNAIKYTLPGGQVCISLVKEEQDRIRFEVSDTGIGIPGEEISSLFSEFFRAENAKELTEEGTGLGLVIVKETLDRLKGTISVKSKVGEGTSFVCFLRSI